MFYILYFIFVVLAVEASWGLEMVSICKNFEKKWKLEKQTLNNIPTDFLE